MIFYYFADICKQITSVFLIVKSLSLASLTEWLTRETSTKYIVGRNVFWSNARYISLYSSTREINSV